MNEKTFLRLCNQQNLDADLVRYNIGYDISELRLYKGKIYKPCWFNNGKRVYQYNNVFQLTLNDCI